MRNRILYPIYLAIAVCIGIAIGLFFDFPTTSFAFNEDSKREQKLRQIIRFIDYEYVDRVNTDSLLDNTINSMMEQLDPHSAYIPRQDVLANEESIRGSFVGIGVEFKIFKDSLTIVRVLPEGPSEKAGLKAGQRILKADSIKLSRENLNAQKVVSTLKGEEGSPVNLEIFDPLRNLSFQIEVKRGEVPVQSVQSTFMVNDTVGMLKLVKFTQRSAREVNNALRKLKKEGARHLIIDLRDNPGGLLTAAEKIADQFLEDDALIVFTKDRQGKKNFIYASGKGLFKNGKLAILINGGSASASEIVAGALQDNDRAVVIGRRSFGKGLVQEEITLNDGSRLRLTTQRYYTPTGRSIQKDFDEYDPGFMEGHNFKGNIPADTSQSPDQEFTTPAGRTVRGGGGIRPDVTVNFDSATYNQLLYHLAMTVNLDEKAFSYVDAHRQELRKMPEGKFIKEFAVDSALVKYFFGSFSLTDISDNPEGEISLVKNRIKAFLAYNLYGNTAYQKVYSQKDPYIRQALQALENNLLDKSTKKQVSEPGS